MTKVFVYGTLKSGYGNNRALIPEDLEPTPDTITGFTMYHLGGFPAIVKDDSGRVVVGEVYDVDDNVLRSLNRLEGYRGEGERNFYDRISVTTDSGEECLVYVQGKPVTRTVVESGNWGDFTGTV